MLESIKYSSRTLPEVKEIVNGTINWTDVPVITQTDDAPYVWSVALWRMCNEKHPIPFRFYAVLLRHGLVEKHNNRVIPTALGIRFAQRHSYRFRNWKVGGRYANPDYVPPKRQQSEGTKAALKAAREAKKNKG